MVVRKEKNHMGTYDIIIEDKGQKLVITFQGNLDLYWQLIKDNYEEKANIPVEITKENYTIYRAFERLFNDVKDCNVFKVDTRKIEAEEELTDAEEEWMLESLDEEIQRVKDLNKDIKRCRKYEEHPLYSDGKISWHCDDEPYETSPVLTISKNKDKFLVNITSNDRHSFGFNNVRMRNSGSRYSPYNIAFMRMFNELQEYNPEYHQIHMDELNYQKKLQLKRQ